MESIRICGSSFNHFKFKLQVAPHNHTLLYGCCVCPSPQPFLGCKWTSIHRFFFHHLGFFHHFFSCYFVLLCQCKDFSHTLLTFFTSHLVHLRDKSRLTIQVWYHQDLYFGLSISVILNFLSLFKSVETGGLSTLPQQGDAANPSGRCQALT